MVPGPGVIDVSPNRSHGSYPAVARFVLAPDTETIAFVWATRPPAMLPGANILRDCCEVVAGDTAAGNVAIIEFRVRTSDRAEFVS